MGTKEKLLQRFARMPKDFINAIDSYIDGCIAEGIKPRKPFSGKLVLRMTSELHSRVAEDASNSGTTINDYINKTLTNKLFSQG